VFTIPVPRDFGDKKLTWTLIANGMTTSIPLSVHKQYQVEPYEEKGMGNTPPILRFEPGGAVHTGPPLGLAATLTATVGEPLTLPAWVTDKPAKITVNVPRPPGGGGGGGRGRRRVRIWSSPGACIAAPRTSSFAKEKPEIDKAADGKTETKATFSAPGDYILRAQANDISGEGGGGFQCCWTNAHVKVTVKGSETGR
jgi:hypothetical protein